MRDATTSRPGRLVLGTSIGLALGAALTLGMVQPAQAQQVTFMTGPQGGSWIPLGGQLKDAWEKAIPGLNVQAVPGAGMAIRSPAEGVSSDWPGVDGPVLCVSASGAVSSSETSGVSAMTATTWPTGTSSPAFAVTRVRKPLA